MNSFLLSPAVDYQIREIAQKKENDEFLNRALSDKEKEFHHSCSILAKEAYYGDSDVKNYKLLKDYSVSLDSGFKANVYENGGDVIIAIAGTHGSSFDDWQANFALKFGMLPEQYDDAMKLYLKIIDDPKYNDKKIYITGHSLGGSLAQLVASTKKYDGIKVDKKPLAITFNAAGQRDLIEKKEEDDDDIIIKESYNTINYCHVDDTCTSSTKEEAKEDHPGKIVMFDSEVKSDKSLGGKLKEIAAHLTETSSASSAKSSATSNDFFKNHRIKNFTESFLPFKFAKVVEQ